MLVTRISSCAASSCAAPIPQLVENVQAHSGALMRCSLAIGRAGRRCDGVGAFRSPVAETRGFGSLPVTAVEKVDDEPAPPSTCRIDLCLAGAHHRRHRRGCRGVCLYGGMVYA